MLPVFFVGGGEGGGDAITVQRKKSHAGGEACGETAMAVIQPYKRRRAAPEARPAEKPHRAPKARPTEKGNLRGDKGGGERGKPTPSPSQEEGRKPRRRRGLRRKSNGCDTAIQKKKSRAKSATYGEEKWAAVTQPHT